MLKILNTKQIREADEFTIKNEPIASIDLMERACHAFVDWFVERYSEQYSILVVCGTGNNGGDGLGIARILHKRNYDVKVSIVRPGKSQSFDFKENLFRLPKAINLNTIGIHDAIEFPEADIVIDAIFGSGLSRPLDGLAAKVVSTMNEMNAIRIAVDCPSGFLMDDNSAGPCIRAHQTVTFQVPKLSFFLPQSADFVGHWYLVDIGLDKAFLDQADSRYFLIDEQGIKKIIHRRNKFDHKGSNGHSLIMAGSFGKIGANILATRAALRIGSGLVTSLTPSCGYLALQIAAPEAMVLTDSDVNELTTLPELKPFSAIGIGPGIGTSARSAKLLVDLFSKTTATCVIDADGINLISANLDSQKLIPALSILTPHPGEFRRLAGDWTNDFEKIEKQIEWSSRLNSIIVLKGAHTSIAMPNGEVYFNATGNPAMATGGSGDVLTGVITGLLAQKYSPQHAAILGVYVHGLAGDFAAKSKATIIASDILNELPVAMKSLLDN